MNYGTDYTVENLIVTVSASLPEGTVLNFYRNTDIVQPTVFPPQVLTQAYETAIDRNTMCIQEVKTDFGELREEVEDFEKKQMKRLTASNLRLLLKLKTLKKKRLKELKSLKKMPRK